MAGYSDTEIETAVSRFVRSRLRIERDALGPVDMDTKFDEVMQLIASTLVYDPNAIFYVINLATNKLNVSVNLAIEYAEDIEEAISEMGYRSKDITRTTLLGDAAAALLTVDQILTDNSVISSRAFTRYQQAVDNFVAASLEPNIKKSNQVVRPPQLARQSVIPTVASLSTTYADILSTLAQVRGMLGEFNGLNLGVLSIQNSVQKVRDDLRTLQSQFEDTSTTRDDKITLCRDAYLSLAAGKSVLDNYTTVSDPSEPRLISSTSVVGEVAVADPTDGELLPATITSSNSGPWEIVTGSADTLKITDDDAITEKTYTFIPPAQPSITSTAQTTFDIVTGTNDFLEVDGFAVPLNAGVGKTVSDIVDDITDEIPSNYTASVYDTNYIRITKDTAGATEIQLTAENGDAAVIANTCDTLGFYVGQSDSSDGLSAAEAAEQINDAGDVTAEVVREVYESGDENGTIATATSMTLASGTLSDTDHGHVGDMLVIRSGVNAGYYRITSVVLSSDTVNVDASTPFRVTGTDESWVILSERLRLISKAADLSTAITVGSGNINTVMGFTPGTTGGTTTGFRVEEDASGVSFSQLDVIAGDTLRVVVDSVSTEHEILALTSSDMQLEISPPLSTSATISSFRILSAASAAYEMLIAALEEWDALLAASDFRENILELGRVINPLVANKNPSIASLNDARNTVRSFKELLTNSSPDGLTEILVAFWVKSVPRIDAALKMLKERGMDRAYDLIMDGLLAEFFDMDKDDSSSSTYMLKSMRSVVQSDLRTSKLDEDVDDLVLTDSIVGTDPDYDYSDADGDENVRLLGEVPDYEEGSTLYRTRY